MAHHNGGSQHKTHSSEFQIFPEVEQIQQRMFNEFKLSSPIYTRPAGQTEFWQKCDKDGSHKFVGQWSCQCVYSFDLKDVCGYGQGTNEQMALLAHGLQMLRQAKSHVNINSACPHGQKGVITEINEFEGRLKDIAKRMRWIVFSTTKEVFVCKVT